MSRRWLSFSNTASRAEAGESISSEKYLQQTVYLPQVIAEGTGRAAVYRTKSCAPIRCAMDISVIKSSALRDDAFGWSRFARITHPPTFIATLYIHRAFLSTLRQTREKFVSAAPLPGYKRGRPTKIQIRRPSIPLQEITGFVFYVIFQRSTHIAT